jgi:hypothetical protein
MKSSCPKRRVNTSTTPDFCRGSVVQQRILGGGGVWGTSFPQQLGHSWRKSGRVQSPLFIKRLWASQTSDNIFYKKVVSFEILFLSLLKLINFFVYWSLHAQNAVWIRVPHPIFSVALCSNREYLGGGECEESAFLNSLHAYISSAMKGASHIGPQLWGEVFSAEAVLRDMSWVQKFGFLSEIQMS